MFNIGEKAILNEKAIKGLPNNVGEVCEIVGMAKSANYDYEVDFGDSINPVKEKELNKLTKEQEQLVKYILKGNVVEVLPSNEEATIIKADWLNSQAEVQFDDEISFVFSFEKLVKIEKESNSMGVGGNLGKFRSIGLHIGEFTDSKNKQYGSSVDATYGMMKVLMERYKNDDNTYTIPESLLQHILLQVRMMDKMNRIFNNPSGKGDSESPYNDLAGYSLIGIDMVDTK